MSFSRPVKDTFKEIGCNFKFIKKRCTNTSVPLENVTNLLGIVANVLPSTSTNAVMEDSSKSTKKPASANPSGIRRG
jgi:hypothetical protein